MEIPGRLADVDIRIALQTGELWLTPFDAACLQPASYDVHLGQQFLRYRALQPNVGAIIDMAESNDHRWEAFAVPWGSSFVLFPGQLILATTLEVLDLRGRLSAVLAGKSSVGRHGIDVHATAGFIDPGFHGEITMELTNKSDHPVRLYSGTVIAQVDFQRVLSPPTPYRGKYQGQRGPVPSQYHGNFLNGQAFAASVRDEALTRFEAERCTPSR